MDHILRSSLLLLLILATIIFIFGGFGNAAVVQEWGPREYHIVTHPITNEPVLNVTRGRFKRLPQGLISVSHLIPEGNMDGVTKSDCSNKCFTLATCITWSFRAEFGMCRCFDLVHRAFSLVASASKNWETYEMKVRNNKKQLKGS